MGTYYEPFSLRISEELREKIKVIAEIHKRSMNREIEYVMEEYVKDYEREHGVIEVEF